MIITEAHEIALRLFEEHDIAQKITWINNPFINQHLHYDIPLSYEKTLDWFHHKDNSKRLDCVIEYNGIPVGLIGLVSIDRSHNKAEFYISMGEPAYMRHGIATYATQLLLDYAFNTLSLHKVYLNTDGENFKAHRLFEKTGFQREGYFVDDMIHRGQYIDRIRYAIVKK